jgi:acetyltransferase-like isoleucine patch superfamily enzyme
MWHAIVRQQVLSPELPLFFNDGDLYDRLRAKGFLVQVVPGATAAHGYSTSLHRLPDARKRAEFVFGLRVWAKHWWPLRRRVVLWFLLLADAVLSRGPWRRGTLGGLGLPGGAQPWLSTYPPLLRRLRSGVRSVKEAAWQGFSLIRRRARRRAALRRWRWAARLNRARLLLDVDGSADIARDVVVEVRRGQTATLVMASNSVLQSGVTIRLWGGRLEIGKGSQVRHSAVLTVKGLLMLGRRCVISRGTNVHADGTMVWEFAAAVAEGATVVDSSHQLGTILPIFDLPTKHADITLGAGCFVGANAVVTAGVTVGRRAVVGAGCVVTKDVPEGAFVSGEPARLRGGLPGVGERPRVSRAADSGADGSPPRE